MTQILNTSACDEETEGDTCEHCNTFIKAIVVEVPTLRIKNKVLPTCECVVEREEAATIPLNRLTATMKEMVQLAEDNGISYRTFRSRVVDCGWQPDKAATTPIRKYKRIYKKKSS
ncbi:hypothetical protein MN033_09505 [Bacillus nitratireducens]|uniref:hypothetical protein n=1 Tax=Bacillus nitratireducens TaxID=2026193 RepID=UPI001F5792D1|nr:hypothetical protein [Bacillus nitratireducens]UNP79217.1 hypothetical protein MN033_09505 [Bacillus nitratireducens]